MFFCEFCKIYNLQFTISHNTSGWLFLIFVCKYSSVPNNGEGEGGLNKREGPTNNLNINQREAPNKSGGGGGLKIVLSQSGNRISLIMGITSTKSRSARGVSQQPAFMDSCLTISHTCLPFYVFASFTFLMFTVFSFQEKWESLHSRLRRN